MLKYWPALGPIATRLVDEWKVVDNRVVDNRAVGRCRLVASRVGRRAETIEWGMPED